MPPSTPLHATHRQMSSTDAVHKGTAGGPADQSGLQPKRRLAVLKELHLLKNTLLAMHTACNARVAAVYRNNILSSILPAGWMVPRCCVLL